MQATLSGMFGVAVCLHLVTPFVHGRCINTEKMCVREVGEELIGGKQWLLEDAKTFPSHAVVPEC